ncbi:kinase-like domain-containing protein [Epithele typhae]|uniref:kinase-like domain-containing protein n=1 Tax=Epithele typhae TaxID=378194 RepID=UPI0020081C83|nr:kinase-like domain-containing protein [Epithele typhae]KAH9946038.1 kinase-like domain-containing protein [Epithele typhae]
MAEPASCHRPSARAHRHPLTRQDDDDATNARLAPRWYAYRCLLEGHGFRLETCKDVKQSYHDYWAAQASEGRTVTKDLPGYIRACRAPNEDELCQDAGLPDRLFRGTQCATGAKVVIKAVHIRSRELDVIRYLSSPAVRNHPMNHCIPVLALVDVPQDKLAFIVMEEWCPQLTTTPCNLGRFFHALRQCIEHIAFMHSQRIAHLDISIRNVLTDCRGHYAVSDYELSHRFPVLPGVVQTPRVAGCRRTECPPELERGESSDPYKVDVYGLGVLILRAMDLTGYEVPELRAFVRPLLRPTHEHRPTVSEALLAFDAMVAVFDAARLAQLPRLCH